MDNSVDAARVVWALVKRAWLVAAVSFIFAAAGLAYLPKPSPDIFTAKVSVYSMVPTTAGVSSRGFDVMKENADIVSSKKVAGQVVEYLNDGRLTVGTVQSMLHTSYEDGSTIFYVYANSEDPQLSIAVVNAAAEAFITEIRSIIGEGEVRVQILDKADTAYISFDGKSEQLKVILIFTSIGFFLVCTFICLTEILSTRVSAVDKCTLGGTIKLIGVIPNFKI